MFVGAFSGGVIQSVHGVRSGTLVEFSLGVEPLEIALERLGQ